MNNAVVCHAPGCGATESRLPANWLRVTVTRLTPSDRFVDAVIAYCPKHDILVVNADPKPEPMVFGPV